MKPNFKHMEILNSILMMLKIFIMMMIMIYAMMLFKAFMRIK